MRRLAALAALLLVPFVLTACEEDVTAVLGTDRVYSVYGVFSPTLDTQAVLVFPIEPTLGERAAGALDAVVTSTDLVTGETRTWRDSLVANVNGGAEHVFWSRFRAVYGHRYRLRVERSDGEAAEVEVEVPVRAGIEIEEPTVSVGRVSQGVRVTAPVPRLLDVVVSYRIRTRPDGGPESVTSYRVDYTAQARPGGDGWIVPVNLSRDYDDLAQIASGWADWQPGFGLTLLDMEVTLIAADAAWDPPGGTFDPDLLVQPGLFSNVTGGFGFVGAGYRLRRLWVPPAEYAERAGFRI